MKIIGQPFFQGDLGAVEIDALPDGMMLAAPTRGEHILAHSETGHHHVVEARTDVRVWHDPSDPLTSYLMVGDAALPLPLIHKRATDTHAPQFFLPGKLYQLRRQREAAPEGWRRAAD